MAALAEFAEAVVIVHDRHVDSIERWLRAHPGHPASGRVRFVAVGESDAMLRLAAATPPNLLLWRIRYLLWLRRAHDMASRLEREEAFEVAIHATLGIYWLPSPVTRLRTPAVWGPVGGAASSPRCLWPELGLAGLVPSGPRSRRCERSRLSRRFGARGRTRPFALSSPAAP